MKTLIKTATLFMLMWQCTACVNHEKTSRLQSIDSLISRVHAAKEQMDSINWDRIENQSIVARENLDYVQKNYRDTMPKQDAEQLTMYYDASKGFARLISLRQRYSNETDFTLTQLENLKNDLQNNLLKEDKFRKYYASEAEAVKRISIGVAGIPKVLAKVQPLFDSSGTYVNRLVARIRQAEIEKTNRP